MFIPAIIYVKIQVSEDSSKILFCISQDKLIEFDLTQTSPTNFAEQNNLTRHDKLDWHVNKLKPICYFFEIENGQENNLPMTLFCKEQQPKVEWLIFPLARKKLSNGTHRNLLQLAVQYISYGGVDDSVIAADYNKEGLENLSREQDKIKK